MTLETLAKDIAASAEAQAKAMLKEAKAEADAIVGEAETKATSITDEASARAGREKLNKSHKKWSPVRDKETRKNCLLHVVASWMLRMTLQKHNLPIPE